VKGFPTSGISYGVALEGGGARGAYQIGAWKALRELNIDIKGVVGTSVGALNGAMMVQDDYDKALEIWENMRYESITTTNQQTIERLQKFDWRPWKIIKNSHYIKQAIQSEGLDIEPLKKMIEETIDEEKIRQSPKDYGLTTVRLTKLKALELFIEEIKPGRLKDFILASAYLPIFKKERLHGNFYLDGGFHNIVPINMLINKGYKNIIVIRLLARGIEKKIKKTMSILSQFPLLGTWVGHLNFKK
jgi:NTE family protein